MRSRDQDAREMAELDRQTGELLSPWFAARSADPPRPTVLRGALERIPDTRRRRGWRIPDWWLWRHERDQRAGFLVATATSVVLLAMVGLASVTVFMVAVADRPSLQVGVGAADASPSEASERMAPASSPPREDPPATTAATAAADEPSAPAVVPEEMIDYVSGTVSQTPALLNEGTTSTMAEGATEVTGIETQGLVAFDDERLSGSQFVTRNELRFGAERGGVVASGRIRLENDGGSWSGTFESVAPPGREGALRAVELTGAGGYEGLMALLHYDLGASWGDPQMITGIVAPGGPPAYPDRTLWDRYAAYTADIAGVKLPETKLREARPRDGQGLPARVGGSLRQTMEWLADDAIFDESWPEEQTMPQWMAGDLVMDDPRLELEGYEVMLNADYAAFLGNGSISYGRGRGWSDAGGAWAGTIRGFSDPEGPLEARVAHHVTRLTGMGAYDGLTAILFSSPDPATASGDLDSWSVEGILFAGALPAYPTVP